MKGSQVPELIRAGGLAWTAEQPPAGIGADWDQRYTTWTYGPDGGPGTCQFIVSRFTRTTPTATYGWAWVIVTPGTGRRDGHLPYEATADEALAAAGEAWAHIRAGLEKAHAARSAAEAADRASQAAEREAAEERALLRQWVRWYKDHPAAIAKITSRYFAVYDPDGDEAGHVLGGGPTRDTAYKSISLNNVGMNAMTAPGWYSPTLEEAAASFMTERGVPPSP
jgi:hypothetical protein